MEKVVRAVIEVGINSGVTKKNVGLRNLKIPEVTSKLALENKVDEIELG